MARLLPLAVFAPFLLLFVPSPALATQTAATRSHGPPGGVYGGRSSQGHPMSLRLTRDGKRLRALTVQVDAGMCSSSPTQTYNLALNRNKRFNSSRSARIRADGSFAYTGRFRAQASNGAKLDFEVALKGKARRTRATGTIRFFGPVRNSTGSVIDRCDSGRVRWKLRRGKVYGGATADGRPLSIRLSRDGRRLKSFFINFLITCDSRTFSLSLNHLGVAVRRDGSFSKRGLSGIPLKLAGGATASGRFLLRGKLGARRASGRYRAVGTLRQSDGSEASCDTGAVRWTARRG